MSDPDDTPTPILSIRDLRVDYATQRGAVTAVDGIELDVHRGEILGIAGESGSGKSTLALALLRLLKLPGRVAGGSVTFTPDHESPIELLSLSDRPLRALRWRRLAYLPQGSMNSLNPVLRIRDQFADVIIEHAPERRTDLARLIPRLLQRVGLDPRVARMYPHELSGGMKQRVLMAICIALDPELIIADEPTTALDVTIQRVILQSLAELRDELGVTLIIISHDLGVHAQLVDRVAIMHQGRLVEVGDVHQIFDAPRDDYTRALIAAIPRIDEPAEAR